ncbi:hypothetical protein ABFS83_04G041200 [Erythranthe nasuta]
MPSFRTLIRYAAMKVDYSVKAAWKSYSEGSIRGKEIPQNIYSNLFHGDMFFSFKTADREVLRLIGPLGATVYFRKMPFPNSRNIRVKDILLLRDPQNPNKHIVREIFATEGTLVANRVLSDGECWVQSSDENLGQNPHIWPGWHEPYFRTRYLLCGPL